MTGDLDFYRWLLKRFEDDYPELQTNHPQKLSKEEAAIQSSEIKVLKQILEECQKNLDENPDWLVRAIQRIDAYITAVSRVEDPQSSVPLQPLKSMAQAFETIINVMDDFKRDLQSMQIPLEEQGGTAKAAGHYENINQRMNYRFHMLSTLYSESPIINKILLNFRKEWQLYEEASRLISAINKSIVAIKQADYTSDNLSENLDTLFTKLLESRLHFNKLMTNSPEQSTVRLQVKSILDVIDEQMEVCSRDMEVLKSVTPSRQPQ